MWWRGRVERAGLRREGVYSSGEGSLGWARKQCKWDKMMVRGGERGEGARERLG